MRYNKINIIKVLYLTFFVFLLTNIKVPASNNNNNNLAQRVQNEISNYYDNLFNITATKNGDVRIEGRVNSLYDKLRIFDIISRVRGVKGIQDFVSVHTKMLPDDMIKSNLEDELRLDKSILEPNRIKVTVANGIVELNGTVSYYRERLMAETIASWQKGAKGIVDNLKVLPPKVAVSDENLRFILKDVLRYHFPIEKKVKFQVHNGVVTLSGYTHTLWAKNHIAKDFHRVKGVKDVINNIKINADIYPNLF